MHKDIPLIKEWLSTGSINIFGLPFSGKDTVGIRLAEELGAKFLSSGLILRAAEKKDIDLAKEMGAGKLADTNKFRDIVLPYLQRDDLRGYPLILSSVGRWIGEEQAVLEAAANGGHPIKAVLLLNISETVAKERWEMARTVMDRGERSDDKDAIVLEERMKEFIEKTMPVIEVYKQYNLLVSVQATGDRETVYNGVINALAEHARQYMDD